MRIGTKPLFIGLCVFVAFFSSIFYVQSARAADEFLKFHWPFNEGSGTTVNDASGNVTTYPGTLYNGPTWLPDGGLTFDGIDDFARTDDPIPNSMGVSDQAYTLSASVRLPDANENGNIIHITNGANGVGWCISMLHVEDGHFRAIGWDDGAVVAVDPVAATPGQWYSIANTWSPETQEMDLYVNGALVASASMPHYTAANEDVYVFAGIDPGGCDNNHGWFKGDIKDVRIYNRAITQQEAQQNSNESIALAAESFSPADNTTNVGLNDNLSITFGTSTVATSTGSISIYKSSDDSLVESIPVDSPHITKDVTSASTTFTINPSITLAHGTGYYVDISSTTFQNATNTFYPGTIASTTWNFETTPAGPTLLGATIRGQNVTLLFDKALQSVSNRYNIFLHDVTWNFSTEYPNNDNAVAGNLMTFSRTYGPTETDSILTLDYLDAYDPRIADTDGNKMDVLYGFPINNITGFDLPTISYFSPTPSNASTQTATSATIRFQPVVLYSAYEFLDFDHSLLGWWRFEGSKRDDSGLNASSSWAGNELYSTSTWGYAGNFNGTTSLEVTLAQPVTSSFTISAWVNLNSLDDSSAIVSDDTGHLLQIGGSHDWQFDNTYSFGSVASTSVWTHLVGVYDASTSREYLYVNGVNVSSTTATRTIGTNLHIGKRFDNNFINGKIDEVLLLGRALGSDEVANLYNGLDYEHQFSDLSLGEHTFAGYVADGLGAASSTSRTFTVVDATSTPPAPDDDSTPTTTPTITRSRSHGGGRVSNTDLARILAPGPATDAYLASRGDQGNIIPVGSFDAGASSTQPGLPDHFKFTKRLELRTVDIDVKYLQIFLNNQGFTVSTSGAGSLGRETTTFGSKTKAALIKFQEAHAAEILTPQGFPKGTGIFGSYSMRVANSLLK